MKNTSINQIINCFILCVINIIISGDNGPTAGQSLPTSSDMHQHPKDARRPQNDPSKFIHNLHWIVELTLLLHKRFTCTCIFSRSIL